MENRTENGEQELNGRYRLLNRIGAGGMSTVYRAQDLALGRLVAVKVMHEGLTGDPVFLKRFSQEAQAAASLSHPNVITVHDVGQDGHRHYIVMELVEGDDLKTIIRRYAPLPLDKTLELMIQVASGIGYAHRAGFVHCDVKPQNVMVTGDGQAKVADFGIARVISEATMSRDDLAWGTPHYFSPEQAAGKSATPSSDVYAIGVIMYEMLTGRLPFEAETPTALALMHLNNEAPWIADLNPSIPTPVAKIVHKVMAKEPSARYRTADQLGSILQTVYEDSHQMTQGRRRPPEPEVAEPVSAERVPTITPSRGTTPVRPVTPPKREPVVSDELIHDGYRAPVAEELDLGPDWMAIFLGAIALLAILGLIPLWAFVYRAYTQSAPLPSAMLGIPSIPSLPFAGSAIFGIIHHRNYK